MAIAILAVMLMLAVSTTKILFFMLTVLTML